MSTFRSTLLASLSALTFLPWLGAAAAPAVGDPGFSVDKMDRSVDPRADFAKLGAGGWYARYDIPADKARWGGLKELTVSK